ncbi:hypothetical protein Q3G72_032217 [Acer saccharum]|nr:hypothetical protein Q3G72_032217 [Acer saccharum]
MAPLSELASVVAPPTQTNMNDWKEVLLVLPKNAATTESGVGMVEQQQKAGGVVINNNISKRRSNDDLPEEEEEDVIEVRRQCRMMKNRESAARSCAKRLAYTAKLEKELDSLKEENKKLKQIVYGRCGRYDKEDSMRRKGKRWEWRVVAAARLSLLFDFDLRLTWLTNSGFNSFCEG